MASILVFFFINIVDPCFKKLMQVVYEIKSRFLEVMVKGYCMHTKMRQCRVVILACGVILVHLMFNASNMMVWNEFMQVLG